MKRVKMSADDYEFGEYKTLELRKQECEYTLR